MEYDWKPGMNEGINLATNEGKNKDSEPPVFKKVQPSEIPEPLNKIEDEYEKKLPDLSALEIEVGYGMIRFCDSDEFNNFIYKEDLLKFLEIKDLTKHKLTRSLTRVLGKVILKKDHAAINMYALGTRFRIKSRYNILIEITDRRLDIGLYGMEDALKLKKSRFTLPQNPRQLQKKKQEAASK